MYCKAGIVMTSIPVDFKGGISHETMINPINLGCHATHNFDRDNILRWFEAGHDTCPMGRAEINPDSLSYNEDLSNRIREFSREHSMLFESRVRNSLDQPKNRSLTELKVVLLRVKSERAMRRIQEVEIDLPLRFLQRVANINQWMITESLEDAPEIDRQELESLSVREIPSFLHSNRYNHVIDVEEEEEIDPESREIDYPEDSDELSEPETEEQDESLGYDVEAYMENYANGLSERNNSRSQRVGGFSISRQTVIDPDDSMQIDYLSERLNTLREYRGNVGSDFRRRIFSDQTSRNQRHSAFVGRELMDIGHQISTLGQEMQNRGRIHPGNPVGRSG